MCDWDTTDFQYAFVHFFVQLLILCTAVSGKALCIDIGTLRITLAMGTTKYLV